MAASRSAVTSRIAPIMFGRLPGRRRQQDALVLDDAIPAVPVPQPVLAAEGLELRHAAPHRLAHAGAVVGVHVAEPALEAAGEAARGQAEDAVEPLAEVDRAGLDVPVVEDVEGDAEEGAQAGIAEGQRRLRRRALDAG